MARPAKPRPAAARVVFLFCVAVNCAVGRECTQVGCCFNSARTILTCRFGLPRVNVLLQGSSTTLQEANILFGRGVSLKSDAVANTQHLRRLYFSDIEALDFQANTQVQVGPNRDISLTVRNVNELRLRSSAFHGWQSELATLTVNDTDSVYIETDAFPPNSTFRQVQFSNVSSLTLEQGAIRGTVTSLQLRNIQSLSLNPSAIFGSFGALSVEDAGADSCPPHAIGGSAGAVTLRSVTVTSVESRCLDAAGGWDRLTIENCTLGHLSSRGVYGSISFVSVSDSRIGSAGPAAVSLAVTELSVFNVTIRQLGPKALQVRAATSTDLSRFRVDHLSTNALSGLRVANSSAGAGVLAVSGLSVGHAGLGALRFAADSTVTLTDLELRGGCVCSSPSWARQLLLGTSSAGQQHVSGLSDSDGGDVTEQQAALLRQIEAGNCTVEGVSLAEFTSEHCGAAAGGLSGDTSGTGGTSSTSGWFYMWIAALTVLLLALAVLLAITVALCRYRRRQRLLKSRLDTQWRVGEEGLSRCGVDDNNRSCAEETTTAHHNNHSSRAGNGDCSMKLTGDPADPADQTDPADSQPLYEEVTYQDWGADRSTGGDTQEAVYANVPVPAACLCVTDALYAVSEGTEGCSCKTARLSAAESRYANIPTGGQAVRQAAEARAKQDARPPTSGSSSSKTTKQVASTERPCERRGAAATAAAAGTAADDLAGAGCVDDLPEYAEIMLAPEAPGATGTAAAHTSTAGGFMVENDLYTPAV